MTKVITFNWVKWRAHCCHIKLLIWWKAYGIYILYRTIKIVTLNHIKPHNYTNHPACFLYILYTLFVKCTWVNIWLLITFCILVTTNLILNLSAHFHPSSIVIPLFASIIFYFSLLSCQCNHTTCTHFTLFPVHLSIYYLYMYILSHLYFHLKFNFN